MTPHPVWFYTLVNAEEHGLGVRYRRRDDGRVRRGADDRLRDALNELGRVQRQLVVREGRREGERRRVAEEGPGTTVTFPPVHLRCVALPVDVPVTPPTTPTTSSASSSDEPKNVRDI